MTIKENFCPLCVLPIIAAAGSGVAGAGVVMSDEEKNTRKKKIIIWTGISVILTAITVYLWLRYKGSCKTCNLV
jgi:predicted nucleic acid-binding Zn ribbon protein